MKRAAFGALSLSLLAAVARANDLAAIPPWVDAGEVPVPVWARSVAPNRLDAALYREPGDLDSRRGSAQRGARLPLFGARRASGCHGRWLNVGPLAWLCSDVADYTADAPVSPPLGTRGLTAAGTDLVRQPRGGARPLPELEPTSPADDGLPFRYFFAGAEGAYGYPNLEGALDDAPDQELETGFSIAAVDEKKAHGETWVKNRKGRWFAARELAPARSFTFRGALVLEGKLDFGWIVVDKASVFSSEKADKASGVRARFDKVRVFAESEGSRAGGAMLRISEEGQPPVWIRARDVSRPRLAPPPAEVLGDPPRARWLDVDLAQQALVAYEGEQPVFATLVSTGKGPKGSELETRTGVHRIWVKIFTTKMDNLARDDVEHHYAIEDVPWVQFFDKAIALHGAFWHRDFGHVHSHGCVNLAPLDARWLFAFTGPHLPMGWSAVYPTPLEPGTVVRVR